MLKSLLKKFSNPKETVQIPDGRNMQVEKIIVPKSAMDALQTDPYKLVQSVVDYVNYLMEVGRFNRFEIPFEAIQAYHCDYYLAQVNNGGHAQFVGNSRANLTYTLADILAGLSAMGADCYLELATKMERWIHANPKVASEQTGFEGGIAPELEQLDIPFYELNQNQPLYKLNAEWIATRPNLMVVDDAEMGRVMEATIRLNPELDTRNITADIIKLNHMLSDPMWLGLGLAGVSAENVEPLIQIGSGSQMNIQGNDVTCWTVVTTKGRRFGVVNGTGAALFERIEGNNPHLPRNITPETIKDVSLDDVLAFEAPKVGEMISAASSESIRVIKLICEGLNVGAAISLLMGKMNPASQITSASVRSGGPDKDGALSVSIALVADNATKAYTIVVDEENAWLLAEPGHAVLATATYDEIDRYSAKYLETSA